jgi:hypothetical protein
MKELLRIAKTEGPVTILHFDGRLDAQTEKLALEHAQAAKDAGSHYLLIDLGGVELITSSGLRALHTMYKMFTPEGEVHAWNAEHADLTFKSPYFKLAQPSSQVHYVLSMAGFLQSIYIHPTLQEALDSFPA